MKTERLEAIRGRLAPFLTDDPNATIPARHGEWVGDCAWLLAEVERLEEEQWRHANAALREVCEFINDQRDAEKQIRLTVNDQNSYAAGFSDGAIEALGEVHHEAARRMSEH